MYGLWRQKTLIMQLIGDFYKWVLGLRRSGTSSLLEKIAKKNDVYILVPTEDEKKDPKWNGKALSFNDLKMPGLKPKPLLLDNHAMIKLAEKAYSYATELEGKLKDRNKLLHSIKTDLLNFEYRNENFDGSPKKTFLDF
jgi:hypothetical protein